MPSIFFEIIISPTISIYLFYHLTTPGILSATPHTTYHLPQPTAATGNDFVISQFNDKIIAKFILRIAHDTADAQPTGNWDKICFSNIICRERATAETAGRLGRGPVFHRSVRLHVNSTWDISAWIVNNFVNDERGVLEREFVRLVFVVIRFVELAVRRLVDKLCDGVKIDPIGTDVGSLLRRGISVRHAGSP